MAEIAKKDSTLEYKLESDLSPGADPSFAWIAHKIEKPIKSRTNKHRQPGVYRIDEALIGGAVLAWQYYIERPVGPGSDKFIDLIKAGEVVKAQKLRKDVGFKRVSLTFDEPFKFPEDSEPLKDGDILIWRCVVVLRQGTNLKQGTGNSLYESDT